MLPDRTGKGAVAPEFSTPELFLDLGTAFEQLTSGKVFNHGNHLADAIGGNGLDQKMDVVFICLDFQELDLVSLFDVQTDLFENLIYVLVEDDFPILGREDQMVDQNSDIIALVSVFAGTHIPLVLRRKRRGIKP